MRKLLAGLAASAAALLVVFPTVPAGAQVPPAGAAIGVAAPRLTLLEQPVAVGPDGSFGVFVAADHAPAATKIAVDIYDRAEPGDVIGIEPPGGPSATFDFVPLSAGDPGDRRTAGFSIQLFQRGERNPDPAWGRRLDDPGVYPVRIRLQDDSGNRLAILMTTLIRLPAPDQQVTQTKAALLVGVHRPPPTDQAARAKPDHADTELLNQLDPLLSALADRPELPATFSVTPDTLARIAGDDGAAAELARLRAEVSRPGRELLDAPYVDIDPASLVGAGLSSELGRQRDIGRQALGELLAAPARGSWQVDHRITPAALGQLRSRGIFRAVLPTDAISSSGGLLAPVDLPAGNGTVRAVAVSSTYSVGTATTDDPVLDAHRLLARLATTSTTATRTPGVVVSIDPARSSAATLRILFDALRIGTPYFAAETVTEALDATPSTTAATLAPVTPRSLGTYPDDIRRSNIELNSYRSMAGGRGELTRPYEIRLATSAADDLDLVERRRDATSVSDRLQEPFTSITIPAKDKVTLGARVASFPLPITSKLAYPVKAVIELEANDRVEFPQNRIEKTLDPGRTLVKIPVRTRAPGGTPVRITVRTPDDGVTLAESQYTVQSTAISGVGLLLTAGAAGFLALWWGRHWYRNRGTARHARRRTRRHRREDFEATGQTPAVILDDDADDTTTV